MSRQKVIQVFEHQLLKIDENPVFTLNHFKALERYGYKNNEKYFSVGNKRIKFNSYVGVIQVGNLTIEILPKADKRKNDQATKDKWHNALIQMLHECKLIKLNTLSNARLKLKSASILDLFYDLFLSETETLWAHGLRKKYRPIEENLNKVKGKINFPKHIRKNAFNKSQFYIHHRIFDTDNTFNQILLKALLILKTITHNPKHSIRINKLLLNLDGVSEKTVTAHWFDKLHFDRNTERYRPAIGIAKLIILKYSPDLKGGNENVLAILFDMNVLFESYIYQKLKAIQKIPNIPITRIKAQNRTPFWESRGLRADIVLETIDRRIVMDTKWKILNSNTPSDADLKQMFVYNLHYDTNLSILLYPKTTIQSNDKKAFRKDEFSTHFCQVAFIDIFNESGQLEKELGIQIYERFLRKELVINEL